MFTVLPVSPAIPSCSTESKVPVGLSVMAPAKTLAEIEVVPLGFCPRAALPSIVIVPVLVFVRSASTEPPGK